MRRALVPLAVLFAAIGTVGQQLSATEAAAGEPPEDALPRVFLLDAEKLAQTGRRVASGDRELAPAMAGLRRDAEEALGAGPFSVVNNKSVPPSGDGHDYMSVGPYWWPDPNKPDGKPYIRRDGQVNPERNEYDSVPQAKMLGAVNSLALAYYLTGHEPYAAHAAKLLRTWFLDDATRMNPNLNFGQGIPGHCDGRGVGIIDTLGLPRLIDSVGMLAGSKAWTETDQEALQAWFAEYLQWVLQSKYGRDEGRAKNNHGTWYDVLGRKRDTKCGEMQSEFGVEEKMRHAAQATACEERSTNSTCSKRWYDAIMIWSGSFRLAPSLAERDGFVLRQGTIHL